MSAMSAMKSGTVVNLTRTRPPLDAPALMAAIAGGDLGSLGVLFDEHAADVRRFLARLGIASAELDDLVQETFLDVHRAAGRFRADAPLKPWLFGVAAMVARRHRRSFRRLVARMRRLVIHGVEESPPTPADEYDRKTRAARGRRALDALSPCRREAFVLVALEGMSGEQAAAALQIPVATVWTRIHHARRELLRRLGDNP
jgi:RNA polymerase sigma-70 factor (ECF subfamily)